jgi:hypothetical protein
MGCWKPGRQRQPASSSNVTVEAAAPASWFPTPHRSAVTAKRKGVSATQGRHPPLVHGISHGSQTNIFGGVYYPGPHVDVFKIPDQEAFLKGTLPSGFKPPGGRREAYTDLTVAGCGFTIVRKDDDE